MTLLIRTRLHDEDEYCDGEEEEAGADRHGDGHRGREEAAGAEQGQQGGVATLLEADLQR